MLSLTYQFDQAGSAHRPPGFDSGWRVIGDTLISHVRGAPYVVETAAERHVVEPDRAFLVPAGLRHRVSVPGEFAVTTSFINLACLVHDVHGLFSILDRVLVFSAPDSKRIRSCHSALMGAGPSASVAGSADATARLAELVALAVRACPELEAWGSPPYLRLLPALRFIREHLEGPIDRRGIAATLGVSIPHLHTLFTAAFQLAPMDVVRIERIQRARNLLYVTSLPIAEIAARCGFEDPYYFSRAFRRAEGVAPREYRHRRWTLDGPPLSVG